MILTAGVLCCNQKCDFCHQSKIKEELFTIITPVLVHVVDKTTGYLCCHRMMIFYTDIQISQILLKRYMLFFLMSAWLQTRLSLVPEQARKQLVKTCNKYWAIRILLVLWKLSKNSCERVVRYKYMHKVEKMKNMGLEGGISKPLWFYFLFWFL